MAGASYATPDDYVLLLGLPELSEQATAQITANLAEISALMRQNAARLDERLDEGTLDLLIPRGIAVRAVYRYLDNPRGAVSLTSGPFSRTYSAAAVSDSGLWLTQKEIDELQAQAAAGTVTSVGTARLGLAVRPCPERRRRGGWGAMWR